MQYDLRKTQFFFMKRKKVPRHSMKNMLQCNLYSYAYSKIYNATEVIFAYEYCTCR